MAQRLFNLSKWSFLEEGTGLYYWNPRPRPVVLELNCPDEIRLYIAQDRLDVENNPKKRVDEEAGRTPNPGQWSRLDLPGEGDPKSEQSAPSLDDGRVVTFLALVKGRDRVEFFSDGAFELIAEGGSVYVYTADSTDIALRVVAPVIFTRIANRKQRNPHLEMMEYQMRMNQQRMQNELLGEMERRERALEQRLESYAKQRNNQAPPDRVGKPKSEPASTVGDKPPESVGNDREDGAEGGAGEKPARKRKSTPASSDD